MTATKILVAQGGGPTAVINQSLVGVVLEARRMGPVERIYGARHGVRGIVNEDFVDLTQETSHNLELVAATPGSALGSTRDKPDLKYCQQIFEVLRAHDIGYFFYIGGNDSSDTVRIVSEEASQGRLPAALHPHPQDHRQRPGVQRPHARLPVGGALRRPGLRRRQPRQRRAARRVHGGGDGPARRLPDGGLGAGQEVPRRRAAPDLPARARLRHRQVPGRRARPPTSATAAASSPCPRASTMRRASRC